MQSSAMKFLAAILLCCAIFFGITGVSAATARYGASDASDVANARFDLSCLRTDLRKHQIDRIDVIVFPIDYETFTAITPERLELGYLYRLEVRRLAFSQLEDSLDSALKKIQLSSGTTSGHDYRIRIDFVSSVNLYRVYVDQSGQYCIFDGYHAFISPEFFAWVKQNILTRLQFKD